MGKVWNRIIGWVRLLLSLEPVVVQGIVRALLVVIVTGAAVFGLELDTSALEGRIVALIAAVWLLSELLGAAWARARSTATVKVVEVAESPAPGSVRSRVIAGPANDIAHPGSLVRYIDNV